MKKYKKFIKNVSLLKEYPIKLFKFKQLKWQNFKSFLKKKKFKKKIDHFLKIQYQPINKKKIKFSSLYKNNKQTYFKKRNQHIINILIIKNQFYVWERYKDTFKRMLQSRQTLRTLYNNAISFKYIKNASKTCSSKLDVIKTFLIKPLYKLEILFWVLNFCKSTAEFKQLLQNKKIKINDRILKTPVFLKKGDIISSNFFFKKKKCLVFFPKRKKILSFIETDFYTGIFVITRGIHEIKLNTFFLSLYNYFSIQDLNNSK